MSTFSFSLIVIEFVLFRWASTSQNKYTPCFLASLAASWQTPVAWFHLTAVATHAQTHKHTFFLQCFQLVCPTVYHNLHEQILNMTTRPNYPESLSYTDSQAAPHRDWIDRLGWSQDISTLSKQSWRLWNQNILTPGEVQWDQRRLGCCPTRMRPRPCAFFPRSAPTPGSSRRELKVFCPTHRHKAPQTVILCCHGHAPTNCQFQHILEAFCICSLFFWETIWTLFRNKSTHMQQVYENFRMTHFSKDGL